VKHLELKITLREQVLNACRHLLSEINRDPATPTYGCFDRRYWAWKTIDFPEATFQRNLASLAWLLVQPESSTQHAFLSQTIKAGLIYACQIQHKNGSFDQAYPYEASYGATAFLVPDLLDAYLAVKSQCSQQEQVQIEAMLSRAASFLNKHAELHGTISNHLAGAALALQRTAIFFENKADAEKAEKIVQFILDHQSTEGWYVEYGGADPGYQTLCMYYLAQFYQLTPENTELRDSLAASLDFLQYFIHPDGTFGGEYGSRRTEIYYPGGIALLSVEFPIAAAMNKRMLDAIQNSQTTNLTDIDMGNTAPLLNNYIKALTCQELIPECELPFTQDSITRDFPEAGMMIRSTAKYYCVVGASTGGVTKIFDKKSARLVLDDCGLLGLTSNGYPISTQMADPNQGWQTGENTLQVWGFFYQIKTSLPGPFNFMLLRFMNLTFMRLGFLNELVKKNAGWFIN